MIKRLLEIPFILWPLIAAGLGYWKYNEWQNNVYNPMVAEIAGKQSELASIEARLASAEDFKRRRQEKLQQLQELAERFKATSDQLPRSSSIPDLLKTLADLSDRAGLEFSRFRPQAERRDQFLVITSLDVTLRGTYLQIMSFLDSAANIRRVVAAEKLTLATPVARGSISLVNAQATLLTYHIDDATIDAPIALPPAAPGANPPVKGANGR